MTSAMHHHTPELRALDARGLVVRQINWHRSRVDEQAHERVERTQYDAAARSVATWDPRLSARLGVPPEPPPNLATIYSLSGKPLTVKSVDSGWETTLCAEAGNLMEQWDSRQSHWVIDYDDFLRPTAIQEKTDNQAWRTSERFEYADNSEESAAHNLCGLMTYCHDGAGSQQTHASSLLGHTLQETRRFLRNLDLPDWPPDASQREQLLEPGDGASSYFTHDATGALLAQIDARGNRQTFTYGESGNLQTISLAPSLGDATLLLHSLTYNAFSRIESQTAGNGVVSRAFFDPIDGRLQALLTCKASAEPVQHLIYGYDPIGNVVEIEDRAQPVRHFANQRVDPVSRYGYDSLYQLINATGREIAGSTIRPALPDLLTPLPIDTNRFVNYTQRFSYDEAGNLLELKHEGSQPYTRRMVVDFNSNRALPWGANEQPPDFGEQFDANGNLQALAAGRPLRWTARNLLLETCSLSRTVGDNDSERYAYDAQGVRLRKHATARTRSLTHLREVRYLPGLEIHFDSATGERLEVIDLQAGRTRVRHLHWVAGRPSEISDNQIRYNVPDHLGSAALELDNEARLISHEGYYPFGGTAWWAGRSSVEASYKTIRYSNRERDASGLYYYGLRYYAPWLQRWINPDPGDSPGDLNRYRMVGNGPVTRVDLLGLEGFDFMIAAAVAITALLIGIAAVLRQRAPKEETIDVAEHELSEWQKTYGLNDEELQHIRKLRQRLSDGAQLALHQTAKGQIRALRLENDEDRKVFSQASKMKHGFMAVINKAGIFSSGVRAPEQRRPSSRLQQEMLGLTPTDSESGTRDYRISTSAQMRGYQRRSNSESEASTYPSSEPSSSRGSTAKYQVETGDFFESKHFRDASKRFKDEDVQEILQDAIDALVFLGAGNPHIHTGTKELSIDVKLGRGQGHGRGAYRLLFRKSETGSWKPHRVADPHK